jgi:hypothetical protein
MSGCDRLCLWCERPFPAHRGGSPQRFCTARCRTAFWTALRRWGERAVSTGILAIADIRDRVGEGDGPACTLLPGAVSPAPIPEHPEYRNSASVAADDADEVVGLLDELLCALIELPGDIMTAIPEPLSDRLDRYIEERLEEADSQP